MFGGNETVKTFQIEQETAAVDLFIAHLLLLLLHLHLRRRQLVVVTFVLQLKFRKIQGLELFRFSKVRSSWKRL